MATFSAVDKGQVKARWVSAASLRFPGIKNHVAIRRQRNYCALMNSTSPIKKEQIKVMAEGLPKLLMDLKTSHALSIKAYAEKIIK